MLWNTADQTKVPCNSCPQHVARYSVTPNNMKISVRSTEQYDLFVSNFATNVTVGVAAISLIYDHDVTPVMLYILVL